MTIPTPIIIDISEHQQPKNINYDLLAKSIAGVIIRVQYGSNYIDNHYLTHIKEFKKRGVPFGVYAWVRGSSINDMKVEASDFYKRVASYNPSFWWLDVEEQSMSDMRNGCEAFRQQLKSLGAKKVGVYIANHLYSQFNLDMSKFDGIWIPTYGVNNGQYNGSNPTATNNYNLHQYTSEGRLNGYAYPLDLNRLVKGSFEFFFGDKPETTQPNKGALKVKTITTTVKGVKLRSAAKVNNKNIIAELPLNTQININDITIADGFVWGMQPRADGTTGYIDIGKSVSWVK